MRARALLAAMSLLAVQAAAPLAQAAGAPKSPPVVEPKPALIADPQSVRIAASVRAILDIQARIAAGDASQFDALAEHLSRTGASFWSADPAVWLDRANAERLYLFTLIGGDPRVLRRALAASGVAPELAGIGGGVAALVAGQADDARAALLPLRNLPVQSTLAAAIALSLAPLLAQSHPDVALELLDEARLLVPATLLEESAFRRTIALLLEQTRLADALAVVRLYVWRFPRSPYAPAAMEAAARHIARKLPDPAEVDLITAISELPHATPAAQSLMLDLVYEFIGTGRVSAAGQVLALAERHALSLERAPERLRLYRFALSATRLTSDDRSALLAYDRANLPPRDVALLDEASWIARITSATTATQPAVAGPTTANASRDVRARARAAIEGARRLTGATP